MTTRRSANHDPILHTPRSFRIEYWLVIVLTSLLTLIAVIAYGANLGALFRMIVAALARAGPLDPVD
jgi:hypothetical protein